METSTQNDPPVDLDRLVRLVVGVIKRRNGGISYVFASTQYGMGFILTQHNEIVFRDDSLTHEQRKQIAEMVNEITLQNAIALAPPPQRLASKKDVPGG